ncbi:MAG: flagellar brake protein [Chitinophagales bacterium]
MRKSGFILTSIITCFCFYIFTPVAYAEPYNWEYAELPKAFKAFLTPNNETVVSVTLIVFFLALLIAILYEIINRQRSSITNKASKSYRRFGLSQRRSFGLSQQRTYVRVPTILSTNCTFENGEIFNCRIQDISAGGLLIATDRALNINDSLFVSLDLNSTTKFKLKGRVVRVKQSPDDNQILAGVEFTGLSFRERESIIQWIFKHQRDLIIYKRRYEEGHCVLCDKPLSEEARGKEIYCPKCQVYGKK